MPKGNNGNSNCQRRSNCCPGGIEEQQPVKQLSSIPEESSKKLGASESIQAKVELFELKSRGSQEVHEKAEQPKKPVKKPVNTASQEVNEEAEQPKEPVKEPLQRLAKKPKNDVKSKKLKDEKAEQSKKPLKKPLKRLAKKPRKAVKSKRPMDEKAKQPNKAVKKPVNTAPQVVHEKAEQPKEPLEKPLKRLAKKPKNDVKSKKLKDEKAEQSKKPLKKPLKRLAKKPRKAVKPKKPMDEKAKQPNKAVKKPVNTAPQEVHEKAEQPKEPVEKPLKRLAKKPKNDAKSKKLKVEKTEQPKKPLKKPLKRLAKKPRKAVKSKKPMDEKAKQPNKAVKKPVNTAPEEVHEKAEQTKEPVEMPLKRRAKKPLKTVKSQKPKAEQQTKSVKKPVNTASQEVHGKAEQSKKLVKKPLKRRAKKPLKTVKSQKPKAEQLTLKSAKGAEIPKTLEKSGMDNKNAQIGDVSAKDLFKAIQFAAIKQKNQRSYMSEYKLPSINIDIAMANMLARAGEKDKVLLQAIFLHDLVDWTNTSLEEIKEEFGAGVASVVEEVTSIDKGGKFDRELGGKASKEAVNGLSKNGQLIRLSDLLWQMTMLVEAREERDLTSWEKQRITDVKEEMAHYGKDTNIKILAALAKAMDILIKSL